MCWHSSIIQWLFVFLGDSLISWKSKKQTIVSLSSIEAEYRVIAAVTNELIWLRHILHDFGFPLSNSTLIYYDNNSAIKLATNPMFHECTKHIKIDFHFLRDKIIDKTVRLIPIRTQYQLVSWHFNQVTASIQIAAYHVQDGPLQHYDSILRGHIWIIT